MGFDLFSPGCNCKLIFTPSNFNGCEGTFTWCTKPGSVVKLQKNVNGGWVDIQTFQPTDPQQYTVNTTSQHGAYIVQCQLCPGKWATSDPVNTALCGNHSYWFRWHKYGTYIEPTEWNPNGCHLVANYGGSGRYAIVDDYTGGVLIPNTYYFDGVGLTPGIWSVFPESWPTPGGCSTDHTTSRGPTNIKFYSYKKRVTFVRSGYAFDYRFYNSIYSPGCGVGFTIQYIFPNRGVVNFGGVSYTYGISVSFNEIANISMSWNSSLGAHLTGGYQDFVPSSSDNYNYNATAVHSANISLLMPRFSDPMPYLWPDGTSTPFLPFDPTGNTVGVIYDNRVTTFTESGTRFPGNSCKNYNYIYDVIPSATNAVFPNAKQVRTWGPTEYYIRTCAEAANGLNPLPPASVSPLNIETILP